MTEVETPAREADTERLERSPRFWTLPPFLRVLLITDGTVTQSLEAYFADPIEVVVLRDGHLETFRNVLGSRRTNVGAWARELTADAAASAVARSYAIHFGGRPCIEIEETFPESRFVC